MLWLREFPCRSLSWRWIVVWLVSCAEMVELKVKPVPVIIITVLLLTVIYHAWYYKYPGEEQATNNESGKENQVAKPPLSAQDVLVFFKDQDGKSVTWSHATNSKADLESVLKDGNVKMVEADVRLKESVIPVMAHSIDEAAASDFELKDFLQLVNTSTNKGIKLDIKTTDALEPSLKLLSELIPPLQFPVWINSDILKGPNGGSPEVDAKVFFESVAKYYPKSTLSPGWTTEYKESGEHYTQKMMEEMNNHCQHSNQAINFPIRASLARKSFEQLKWLLDNSTRYTITLWHSGNEEVSIEDLLFVRNGFEKNQVFYDLPQDIIKKLWPN